MADVVSLSVADFRLLDARCREHGNSHLRMAAALAEADAGATLERLRALRRMERRFRVDLGHLCASMARRDEPSTHPIERWVLGYVAEWRDVVPSGTGATQDGRAAEDGRDAAEDGRDAPEDGRDAAEDGGPQRRLWITLDRLREVRRWIEAGRMVES